MKTGRIVEENDRPIAAEFRRLAIQNGHRFDERQLARLPRIHFTGVTDMPYPMVFVDEVYQIDREHSEPLLGYIICNAKVTHAAFIAATTREHWRKVRKFDRRYGVELEWYAIPRDEIQSRQIGEEY